LGTESQLRIRKGQNSGRIPQEFETTARVCTICNDWAILTRKFGAILDGGTVVFLGRTRSRGYASEVSGPSNHAYFFVCMSAKNCLKSSRLRIGSKSASLLKCSRFTGV
jgi:rRNA processing protein Gar1